jgi:hypothetical protein
MTFTVTNTGDSGGGSLRQAITDANNNAGLDTIDFKIPGSGVHTITPATSLPFITSLVVIDGYTQSGSSANTLANGENAVLRFPWIVLLLTPFLTRTPLTHPEMTFPGIGGTTATARNGLWPVRPTDILSVA